MIENHDRVNRRVNGIVAAVLSASIIPLHGALAKERRKEPEPRPALKTAPVAQKPQVASSAQ
jgi:hypothetical protein